MLIQTSAWLLLSSVAVFVSGQGDLLTTPALLTTDNWERMPGSAVQISAKGSELWCVSDDTQIRRWNGSAWQVVPRRASHVAAAADGVAWMLDAHNYGDNVFGTGNGNVFRLHQGWTSWTNAWDQPLGDGVAVSVNAISRISMVSVAFDGTSYRLIAEGNYVALNAADTNAAVIAIGENNTIWRVNVNGNIDKWVPNSWQADPTGFPAPGQAKYIDVQNESRMVVTAIDGNIYIYDGSSWTEHVQDTYMCLQATISPSAVYCVDQFNGIWKLPA